MNKPSASAYVQQFLSAAARGRDYRSVDRLRSKAVCDLPWAIDVSRQTSNAASATRGSSITSRIINTASSPRAAASVGISSRMGPAPKTPSRQSGRAAAMKQALSAARERSEGTMRQSTLLVLCIAKSGIPWICLISAKDIAPPSAEVGVASFASGLRVLLMRGIEPQNLR